MFNFKDKLIELRKSRGMTQDELAKALKVARSTIGNYEKGLREPDQSEAWARGQQDHKGDIHPRHEEEKTGRGRRDQSRESDRLKTILVKIAPKLPRKIKENPEE